MIKSGISVVIPTLGSKLNLQILLKSIFQQDLPPQNLEIILVVNGVSAEVFSSLKVELSVDFGPKMTFIHLTEANVNLARNKGLEKANFDLVYFLDDDCELINKSTFSFHSSSHLKDMDLFALGGGYNLSSKASYWDELYNSIQMSWLLSGKQGVSANTLHLLGGNFSLKKNLLIKNSLKFDERISYGGSEHQLFVEAVKKHLKIQLCNIEVRHNTNESFKKICHKILKQGRGKAIIEQSQLLVVQSKTSDKLSFMSSSEGQFKISTFKDSFLKKTLNYFFWYGYYKQKQTPTLLLVKIGKDFFNYLNYLRFKIIDKFK